jgi:hypothetical protein
MAQQGEKKYTTGLFVEEKAFDWGTVIKQSYKVDDFVRFLQENRNEKGYVNVDVKKSKDGTKMYGEVNSYIPKNNIAQQASQLVDDGLPF